MPLRYLDQLAQQSGAGDITALINSALGGDKDVNNAFDVLQKLRQSQPMRRCLEVLQRDEASARVIKSRELVQPFQPERLRQLKQGSLGRTFYDVMTTINYDFAFCPGPDRFNNFELDADYVNYRAVATHDIHHILTGFSLNDAGENGVLAFSIEQYALPGFTMLNMGGLLRTWLTADKLFRDTEDEQDRSSTPRYKLLNIVRGLEMGSKAQLLFPIDWHARLDQNLDELRTELGIDAICNGIGSWSSDPAIRAATGL